MVMKAYSRVEQQRATTIDSFGSVSVVPRTATTESLQNITSFSSANRVLPKPHVYEHVKVRNLNGTIDVFDSTGKRYISYNGPYYGVYNWNIYAVGFDIGADKSALGQLLDGIRGSNVDVSIDLVQWKITLQMLSLHRRLISGIVKAGADVAKRLSQIERTEALLAEAKRRARNGSTTNVVFKKRASRNRVKRLTSELNNSLDALAAARLEYVYGWRPTMSTIHDLAKGVLRPDKPGYLEVKGRATIRSPLKGKDFSGDAKAPILHEVLNSSRSRYCCYFTPQASVLDNLARISSLNPISILYEATPFSFVLDWAIDISSWLRDYESAFLYRNDFVSGYVTNTYRCSVTSTWNETVRDGLGGTFYRMSGSAVKTTFARTVLGAMPFPSRPRFKLNFGVERSLNALALAKIVLPRADRLVK